MLAGSRFSAFKANTSIEPASELSEGHDQSRSDGECDWDPMLSVVVEARELPEHDPPEANQSENLTKRDTGRQLPQSDVPPCASRGSCNASARMISVINEVACDPEFLRSS